eukprot:TRINITY_DN36658_c2_g1_i1.p1 TRINITY_DN36658_c2_g1~~TRINITY_DN36658_c2_g1_i1.p1  ORF type:complete len:102 (-),score=0.19 TRINITY_DN36658_c2_g1_i1:766-1071(-)
MGFEIFVILYLLFYNVIIFKVGFMVLQKIKYQSGTVDGLMWIYAAPVDLFYLRCFGPLSYILLHCMHHSTWCIIVYNLIFSLTTVQLIVPWYIGPLCAPGQ